MSEQSRPPQDSPPAELPMGSTPEETAAMVNEVAAEGWAKTLGLVCLRASADEVVGEVEVGPEHLQPYGLVHGGVYASILETLASVGAAIAAHPRGQSVVGLENHTTFLRAVRSGRLRATVTPLARGRRTHVWQGTIVDDAAKIAATGSVRLLCLEPGTVGGIHPRESRE